MSDMQTGKWCWSINEENYCGSFDTEDEAHGAAIDDLECECEPGSNSYWIARTRSPLDSVRADYLGDWIEEKLEEWMADECCADDYILEVSKENKTKLGELVISFIRENGKINFYSVTDVKEHTHIVEGKA
jgi:hypothetical protein